MFGFRAQTSLLAAAALLALGGAVQAAEERPVVASLPVYASLGDTARAPIGWVEFCTESPTDCAGGATQPRDIVLSQAAWRDLVKVNHWVNENVNPMTDMDHWGVVEKWSLP